MLQEVSLLRRRALSLGFAAALVLATPSALADTVENCVVAANDAETLVSTNPSQAREKLLVCAADECPEAIRTECKRSLELVEEKLRVASLIAKTCAVAAKEGEALRDDPTKLTRARDRLRACSAPECASTVRDGCTKTLLEVEAAMPTVVLFADSDEGALKSPVRVLLDGVSLVDRIDATAIPIDGGVHVFSFERDGASPVEVRLALSTGQKNVPVHARWTKPTVESAGAPLPPSEYATSGAGGTALPVLGLASAGVGVISLGLGAIFGLVAANKQSDANCPDNRCDASKGGSSTRLRDAQSAGNLSTVFFIGGGVLAAGGLTLYLLAPKSSSKDVSARLRPVVGPNAAAVVLEGIVF
jgi:hypothetical protein